MSVFVLENKVGFTSAIDYELDINRSQHVFEMKNSERDFDFGIFNDTTIENNSLVLKKINDGYERGTKDGFDVDLINLANKTESGWEFKVENQDLIIDKLGFYNLSEYSETRVVTIWDSELKTKLASIRVTADKKSWGKSAIERLVLERDKRFIITVGSYNYSIYTKNIDSGVLFNTNKISFIGARYIDKRLGVFPTKSSNKFYAFPDFFTETDIQYPIMGEYISSTINLSSIDKLKLYNFSWYESEPTKTQVFISFNDNTWLKVNNNVTTPIDRDYSKCKFKIVLESDGMFTPVVDEMLIKFTGYNDEKQKTLTSSVLFNADVTTNEIVKLTKIENIEQSLNVESVYAKKQVYNDEILFNLNSNDYVTAIIEEKVDFSYTVNGDYVTILKEIAPFNFQVKDSVYYLNSNNVLFNSNVRSKLLKSKHVIWKEETREDFESGNLQQVIVTDSGLELEHWNTKYIKEDFSDDKSVFNFIGDWEKSYWGIDSTGVDRGYVYRSKEIGSNQTSSTYVEFSTPINSVDVTISFNYFISSEKSKDLLSVLIDSFPITLSGDLGWQTYSSNLSSGYHRVEFIYRKNNKNDDYLDRACIDEFNVSYAFLRHNGYRISSPIDLSIIEIYQASKIEFEYEVFDDDSQVKLEGSIDDGKTWFEFKTIDSLPWFVPGDDLSGKHLLLKEYLSCNFNKSPILSKVTIDILGFIDNDITI